MLGDCIGGQPKPPPAQVYHGAMGLQTSSSFLSTSACDTGWKAQGLPPPPPLHSLSSSWQVWAGLQKVLWLLSSFPQQPQNLRETIPVSKKPLQSLCIIAWQSRYLAEPVPELPKPSLSPQVLPASPQQPQTLLCPFPVPL